MKIAVIGGGVSGMVAAHLLADEHDLTLFEANDYIGGHTNTINVPVNGESYAVDTGFIVFNLLTYPNFTKLLNKFGIGWKPSDMSFSVQSEESGLEYSPKSLGALFAQKRNLFSWRFYRMLLDVFRFKRESLSLLATEDYHTTLGQYLEGRGYSKPFINHFIIPMGEAIWSADPKKFNDFPARYFVQFFKRHAFLNVRKQPQWLVVEGGSKSYVGPLTRPYHDRIRLNSPVEWVRRHTDHVEVKPAGADTERFDQVVIAAHSDQALRMLADPSELERELLSAIPYQENFTVLHTDVSLLPRQKIAWASWNYHIPRSGTGRVTITYDMNILQGLRAPIEFCVTLNPPKPIDGRKVIRELIYHHPIYTNRGPIAQKLHDQVNGVNRTYFCGAYWGYGFHEDGVNSALAVCKHFGRGL